MNALVFCVFSICTLTLIAAEPNPTQLAEADKVAHAYMEAWLAGDFDKAIVMSDVGHAFGTAGRVGRQIAKANVITEILEWSKPEVCETEFVAIKFTAMYFDYKNPTPIKQVWWLGLVEVNGAWKICYANPLEANRPKGLAGYVKRKAAVKEDALKAYQNAIEGSKRLMASHQAKEKSEK